MIGTLIFFWGRSEQEERTPADRTLRCAQVSEADAAHAVLADGQDGLLRHLQADGALDAVAVLRHRYVAALVGAEAADARLKVGQRGARERDAQLARRAHEALQARDAQLGVGGERVREGGVALRHEEAGAVYLARRRAPRVQVRRSSPLHKMPMSSLQLRLQVLVLERRQVDGDFLEEPRNLGGEVAHFRRYFLSPTSNYFGLVVKYSWRVFFFDLSFGRSSLSIAATLTT